MIGQVTSRCKMICISPSFGIYVRCTQTVSASHQSSWLSSEARRNSGMGMSNEIEDSGTKKYNLIRLQSVDKRHPIPTTQLCVWSQSTPRIQQHFRQTDCHRILEIHMYKEAGTSSHFPGVFRFCLNLKQRHQTLPG